ncbi:MAG: O-antigen ligase domain-containing protein [Bacteroidetes bacterium]|nr:MAG: O-antigen ligase domain-containing protein [Bacteroidota bacterium]
MSFLKRSSTYSFPLGSGIVLGLAFYFWKWPAIALGFFLPFLLLFLIYSFNSPRFVIKTSILFSFFAVGLTRYLPGPIGLTVDFLLLLAWVSIFMRGLPMNWSSIRRLPVISFGIWFIYICLQLFNPEASGFEPWFYAMRGIALYPVFLIPLVLLCLDNRDDLNWFIKSWFLISILAALKGFYQKYVGCDSFELQWLNQGGAVTHILFGQLRAFSFYSDAGQFGAAMSHASLCSLILSTGPYSKLRKLLFFLLSIFFFWAYLISGTRGAIAVMASGLVFFLLLNRNFTLLLVGSLAAASFYYFMAHTNLGQNTYEIRRLRTAFKEGSDEKSFQVRIENQRRLKLYLQDKPFGGGIGSAGDWGQRFNPNSTLANIATDSYYVRIWAETGAVGLTMVLILFGLIIFQASRYIWSMPNGIERNQLISLCAGLFGVMVASYGNSVISQFPTSIICYVSIAFLSKNRQLSQNKNPFQK